MNMKRIGLGLLVLCIICLMIGVILLPKEKKLIVDVQGIINSVVWLLSGYVIGQAGLLLFVAGMNREHLLHIERLLHPSAESEDAADTPAHA
ncbi:MAG: hypothetical protein WCY74_06635 [Sphaerochaetaceae bacterium]|nr:hypothetical protein [Sphaerochaetaceae bacterium]